MIQCAVPGYSYFGRQCHCCGAYLTYTLSDVLTSQVLACPDCGTPFKHIYSELEDKVFDVEPSEEKIKELAKMRGGTTPEVIVSEYGIGDTVWVAYDTFYTDESIGCHFWKKFGKTTVTGIEYDSTRDEGDKIRYRFSDIICCLPNGAAVRTSCKWVSVDAFEAISNLRLLDLGSSEDNSGESEDYLCKDEE